jgi:hypothetical protein
MVEATFFGGVYGFGVGESFGGMAEFCDGCNIDLGLPCSVRLGWFQLALLGSLGCAAACGACEMVAMGQIEYRTAFRNRAGYGRTGPGGQEVFSRHLIVVGA